MKRSETTLAGVIAGLIAVGVVATSTSAYAQAKDDKAATEKCYGVSKAGQNDCQTKNSACAGTAKQNNQKDAWILVPKGTCEKIVGGAVTAKK